MLLEGRSRNINDRQQHVLISDNLPVRKSYFDYSLIARILRRFFLRIILKRTSTEAHV